MPIYAYKCSACGLQQDVMQKMSDAQRTVCPGCSQETFAKQLTAAGFQLKGNGYYATDFKTAAPVKKDEAAPASAAAQAPAPACASTGGAGACPACP